MNNRNYITAALSTFAVIFLSLPAAANELLPQQHYADELQRCVAAIRAELIVDSETPLQHQVTDISKANIWYEFAIATVAAADAGSEQQVVAETQCRAWRFNDKTVAIVEAGAGRAAQLASLP